MAVDKASLRVYFSRCCLMTTNTEIMINRLILNSFYVCNFFVCLFITFSSCVVPMKPFGVLAQCENKMVKKVQQPKESS